MAQKAPHLVPRYLRYHGRFVRKSKKRRQCAEIPRIRRRWSDFL